MLDKIKGNKYTATTIKEHSFSTKTLENGSIEMEVFDLMRNPKIVFGMTGPFLNSILLVDPK